MNWTALYAILKKSINTTKVELEQEITEKIGLTNQFLDELPEVGESGVLYFIPKDNADPSAEDQYFMYVWDPDNTEFVLLDPDMDMSPYAKTADLATVATSGAYSDLSGTPDLTPYITEEEADEKYMSGDVLDDGTVTGNPITFESLDGGYAKSCEVEFGPIQSGSGDPSPSNPRPISGRGSVVLNQCEKNIFDEANNTIYNGSLLGITSWSSSETARCYAFPCLVGKQVTVSFDNTAGIKRIATVDRLPANPTGTFGITHYQKTDMTNPYTFAPEHPFIVVQFDASLVNNRSSKLQVEYGSTATAYEPWQGTTHTATFPDIEYGVKVVWKDGVVKAIINKALFVLDSEGTTYSYNSTNKWFTTSAISSLVAKGSDSRVTYALCENYKPSSRNIMTSDLTLDGLFTINSSGNVLIRDLSTTDVDVFKTRIAGVKLAFPLATPTEITLTPETIELLKGNNVLFTDGDNIKLTAAQLELVKVIANPSGQATGTLNKIQINNDILGIPAELPAVTSSDEGKALLVNSSGNWTAANLPTELPAVTSSDEGKALLVNDQGQWVAGELPEPSGGWTDVTGTLAAGQTAITLNSSAITADSTIDVYTNKFGVNPTNIVVRPPQVKTLRQALVSQESELDITVTANTNWNGYDPWKAFGDDSVNGAWIGDGGDPHYLQIEFDTPTSIREIDFISKDSQRSHAISRVGYSSDGTTFTECGIVSSTMTNDTGHCELDDDYEAKYFRFYFDGAYGISEYPDMSKVEVYGYDEDPQGTGSVTLIFDAQSTNTGVKVRVS